MEVKNLCEEIANKRRYEIAEHHGQERVKQWEVEGDNNAHQPLLFRWNLLRSPDCHAEREARYLSQVPLGSTYFRGVQILQYCSEVFGLGGPNTSKYMGGGGPFWEVHLFRDSTHAQKAIYEIAGSRK